MDNRLNTNEIDIAKNYNQVKEFLLNNVEELKNMKKQIAELSNALNNVSGSCGSPIVTWKDIQIIKNMKHKEIC